MRRIRLILSYEGTEYVGWQTQPNGVSVQQTLEEAVFAVTGERVSLQGSGRTDSGVHARAQVAHFDTNARMAADKFAIALNTHLPGDIRVLYSEEADPSFHARFSAKNKEYHYLIKLGPHEDVFTRRYALHVHYPLYLPDLEAAAAAALGEHDFYAFKSAGVEMENTCRCLTLSHWERRGSYLVYSVAGNGFLYNMVRILVGTMLLIGSGKLPVSAMEKALQSGNRNDAGPTAPSHGLTLYRVTYPDFDTEEVLSRLDR